MELVALPDEPGLTTGLLGASLHGAVLPSCAPSQPLPSHYRVVVRLKLRWPLPAGSLTRLRVFFIWTRPPPSAAMVPRLPHPLPASMRCCS